MNESSIRKVFFMYFRMRLYKKVQKTCKINLKKTLKVMTAPFSRKEKEIVCFKNRVNIALRLQNNVAELYLLMEYYVKTYMECIYCKQVSIKKQIL